MVLRPEPFGDDSLSHGLVQAVADDASGGLWAGTFRGLDRLRPDSAQFDSLWDGSGAEPAVTVELDPAGTRRREAFRGTVARLVQDGSTVSFASLPERLLPGGAVQALLVDSDGTLWIGARGGLAQVALASSGLGDATGTVYEDAEGNLWIGTDAGLNLLAAEMATAPPGTGSNRYGFGYFTEADGLPDHTVYAILPDDEGNLWLSTNRGLARFDPATETFIAFDLDDGLQALEFNGGAQLRGSDGRLYFGGVDGFNVFRAGMVERNAHVPPVVTASTRKVPGTTWAPRTTSPSPSSIPATMCCACAAATTTMCGTKQAPRCR